MNRRKAALLAFFTAALLLVLVKLWLTRAQPQFVIGGAGHDDLLFIRLAKSIKGGHWLGPYDELTLAKGPLYPCWIALLHLLGIPLRLGTELANIIAGCLAVLALRPLIRSHWARLGVFAVLLANPMSYEMGPMGRVIRQALYAPLSLGIMACCIALVLRPGARTARQLPWAVGAGLLFGLFWLTREEGVWLVPGVALLAATFVFRSWILDRTAGLRRSGVALSAGLAAAGAPILVVCLLNWSHYGWFGTVEFRAAPFKDAYGALSRIRAPLELPLVHVPRAARERAYAHSPAFASLRHRIEGDAGLSWSRASVPFTHTREEDLEMGGGWFMWMLRQVVREEGHARSPSEALAFYQRIADEINAACDDGKIPALPRRSGFFPPWQKTYTHSTCVSLATFSRFFLSFDGFHAASAQSVGDPEQLALFRRMTGEVESDLFDHPRPPPTPASRARDAKIAVLETVGGTLCTLIGVANLLAIGLLLLRALISLRRRDLGAPFVICLSLIGVCFASVLLNTLVHVTSFPTLSTAAFAQLYPLILLFDLIVLADFMQALRVWREAQPAIPAAAQEPKPGTPSPLQQRLSAHARAVTDRVSPSLLVLLGVIAVVISAKAGLLREHGSEVPFMNQWDSEARSVLIPYAEGSLSVGDLLAPNNEDRPVLGRLATLDLTLLNGQWDPRLQMCLNALMHLGTLVLLLAVARGQLGTQAFAWCAAFATLLFALPLGWENTLFSHNSDPYLMLLLGVGALLLLIPSKPLGLRWCCGFALAVLSLGTSSGGFLAAAAAAVTLVVKILINQELDGRRALALVMLTLTAWAGHSWISLTPIHDQLAPDGLPAYLGSLLRTLSWPAHDITPALALLVHAPWLVVTITWIRRWRIGAPEVLLVSLGFWVLLQAMHMTALRGQGPLPAISHYGDILALGLLCDAFALAHLSGLWARRLTRPPIPFWLLTTAWICIVGSGLALSLNDQAGKLAEHARQSVRQREVLRDFVQGGDPALLARVPRSELPHPSPEVIALVCGNKALQPFLPPPLLRPVSLKPESSSRGFELQPAPEAPGTPADPLVWRADKGPARFLSQPLPELHDGVLRLRLLASPTLKPDCLSLVRSDGTRPHPSGLHLEGTRWQTAHLEIPAGDAPLRLEIVLPEGAHSFALASPERLGTLSWHAGTLTRKAALLFWPGLALLLLGVCLSLPWVHTWAPHARYQGPDAQP